MSPTRGPPSERRTTLWSHWRRGARARADLIHNISDALTAVPLGIAFLLRSSRAEDNRALRRPRDARAGFRVAPIVVRAIGVWLGTEIVDPLVGLLITLVILKITWDPWRVATRTQPGELVVYGWPAALRSRDHPSGRRAPPAPPAQCSRRPWRACSCRASSSQSAPISSSPARVGGRAHDRAGAAAGGLLRLAAGRHDRCPRACDPPPPLDRARPPLRGARAAAAGLRDPLSRVPQAGRRTTTRAGPQSRPYRLCVAAVTRSAPRRADARRRARPRRRQCPRSTRRAA